MSRGAIAPETLAGHGGASLSPKPTCLIVEDQALIGLSLEAYLEEVGFGGCELVPSSKDALEWLASNTPTIAILDYSLKDGPCLALAYSLRQRNTPFIIYSGHSRSIASRELHEVTWLNKPCDRGALLAALNHLLPGLAASEPLTAA